METIERSTILRIKQLQTGFAQKKGSHIVLETLDFEAKSAEFYIILGRNGTGKTTLLRTIAGLQQALKGTITLDHTTERDPAKLMSIVTTERFSLGYFTVKDVVELGRHPHTGYFGKLTDIDQQAIDEAITATKIEHLLHKPLAELSDGEYQKTMIARALAQDTPLMLLDEPTAHLDLVNRITIFQLLQKLCRNTKKTIIATTHEVELALQFADKIILLNNQKQASVATPDVLATSGQIAASYQSNGIKFDAENKRFVAVDSH